MACRTVVYTTSYLICQRTLGRQLQVDLAAVDPAGYIVGGLRIGVVSRPYGSVTEHGRHIVKLRTCLSY